MTQASATQGVETLKDREVRVFLSSTFRDMNAERAHLVAKVFPQLRSYCAARGVAFTDIDLRWGITEEQSRSGHTAEICLAEIERCAEYPPFFIGFLGERYGWVPRRSDLSREQGKLGGKSDERWARLQQAVAEGIGVTELEMRYAFAQYAHAATHSRVFLRAPQLTDALAARAGNAEDFHDGHRDKLAALKDWLRQGGHVAIDGYTSIEAFGDAVQRFLMAAIDQRYPEDQVPDESGRRRREQALYAQSRLRAYVRRPGVHSRLLECVAAARSNPGATFVCVHAPSGTGKSALIADLDSELRREQPDLALHTHFFGVRQRANLHDWARQSVEDLGPPRERRTLPAPDGVVQQLAARLRERFEVDRRPVLVVLDAIDQLDSGGDLAASELRKAFDGAPQTLVLVTSTRPPPGDWARIELPAFDAEQIRQASRSYLDEYRKALADDLLDALAASPACTNPLFLRMLLEELRLHGDHPGLAAQLRSLNASASPGELFMLVLRRMRDDLDDALHANLGERSARLLALSWRGLRERDLALLLARRADDSPDPLDQASGSERLPQRLLSPLLARLEPYVLRREGFLDLMHASFWQACQKLDRASARLRLLEHVEPLAGGDSWAAAEAVHQLAELARESPSRATGAAARLMRLLGRLRDLAAVLAEHALIFDLGVTRLLLETARAAADPPARKLAWAELQRNWIALWSEELGAAPSAAALRQLADVLGRLRWQAEAWLDFDHGGDGRYDPVADAGLDELLGGELHAWAQGALLRALQPPQDPKNALIEAEVDASAPQRDLGVARLAARLVGRAYAPGARRRAQSLFDLALACALCGRRVAAVRWGRAALRVLDVSGDLRELGVDVLQWLERQDAAVLERFGLDATALLERRVALLGVLGQPAAAVAAAALLARTLADRGHVDAALARLDAARSHAESVAAADPAAPALLTVLAARFDLASRHGDASDALRAAGALLAAFAALARAAAQSRREHGSRRLAELEAGAGEAIRRALAVVAAAAPAQAEASFEGVLDALRDYLELPDASPPDSHDPSAASGDR